jgi:hypothetical protein
VTIKNADELPLVVHGSFERHWDSIREYLQSDVGCTRH